MKILTFNAFLIFCSINTISAGKTTTVCAMNAQSIDENYDLCCSSNSYQLFLYTGRGNLMECCYENQKGKWNYQFGRYCSKHFAKDKVCSCLKNVRKRQK